MSLPRIYLAGPMVFVPEPAALFDQMKQICLSHGLDGVAPTDNQLGLEGSTADRNLMRAIAVADFSLMDKLDGGLFCLDPFRRGPEMDPGTAVEIGYMKALGKPMAGWTRDPRPYTQKVESYFHEAYGLSLTPTPPNPTGGTSGGQRDPDGMLVHSDGMLQNLMIEGGIESVGGAVFADPHWEKAFSDAAAYLASLFSKRL